MSLFGSIDEWFNQAEIYVVVRETTTKEKTMTNTGRVKRAGGPSRGSLQTLVQVSARSASDRGELPMRVDPLPGECRADPRRLLHSSPRLLH